MNQPQTVCNPNEKLTSLDLGCTIKTKLHEGLQIIPKWLRKGTPMPNKAAKVESQVMEKCSNTSSKGYPNAGDTNRWRLPANT